jgi:hypothetical protein
MSIAWVVMSSPVLSAQDLSRYREFHLGMSLTAVAQRAGITSEGRVLLHERLGLIQELMWLPPPGSSRQGDSARKVLFSGYNGQLFRMVIAYAPSRTEGLTAEDMIEALSAEYGLAMLPATEITPSLSGVLNDGEKLLASWENSQYSVNLFRSSYASRFGLVMFSKQVDAVGRTASVKAIRLDEESPQRELERQQKQTEESRVRQEKARGVNKATFQP